MLMIAMVAKASARTIWRWLRLLAVVLGALMFTAVSAVVQACGSGRHRPNGAEDAGRDAGRDAGTDAGRDAAADAGRDAEVQRDAEPLRDADLPDVPLE